jgi:hypothetical protein
MSEAFDTVDYSHYESQNGLTVGMLFNPLTQKAAAVYLKCETTTNKHKNISNTSKTKMVHSKKEIIEEMEFSAQITVKVLSGAVEVKGKASYTEKSEKYPHTASYMCTMNATTSEVTGKNFTLEGKSQIVIKKLFEKGFTHVITGMKYKAFFNVTCELSSCSSENLKNIQGELEVFIKKPSFNVDAQASIEIKEKIKSEDSKLSTTFEGDCLVSCLLGEDYIFKDDIDKFMKIREGMLNMKPDFVHECANIRQISIQPLNLVLGSETVDSAYQKINEDSLHSISTFIYDLDSILDSCVQLKALASNVSSDFRLQVDIFQINVDNFKQISRGELNKMLLLVKSKEKEMGDLSELVDSLFKCPGIMKDWLLNMEVNLDEFKKTSGIINSTKSGKVIHGSKTLFLKVPVQDCVVKNLEKDLEKLVLFWKDITKPQYFILKENDWKFVMFNNISKYYENTTDFYCCVCESNEINE